jgi:prepilin-type N-terminal cleavage/methylation domain-containing protein
MKRRHGFTLVELLVAMALIIFIMAILSQAFTAALTTFRNLKAEGDMAEKLRAVTQLLQRDLAADHFEGKKRLSNPNFWQDGPPSQGFFRIWQGSIGTQENTATTTDTDLIPSFRSADHMLAFTVKHRSNDMGSFFTASVPASFPNSVASFGPAESRYQITTPGLYNYQWAEVAWFLQPSVNPTTLTVDTTPGGIPLFTLFRRQRLLVPDNNLVQANAVPPGAFAYAGQAAFDTLFASCSELSCWDNLPSTNPAVPGQTAGTLYFNNPVDITVPTRRFGMVSSTAYPAGLLYGVPSGILPSALWPSPPNQTSPTPSGTWFYPNTAAPTYSPPLPSPFNPPLIPYYPTLAQQGAGGTLAGADVQLSDVISFHVRVLPLYPTGTTVPSPDPFITLFDAPISTLFDNQNPSFYDVKNPTVPNNPAVFDTWTTMNDGLSANYSASNTTGAWYNPGTATSIPMWNSTQLTYTYPVNNGSSQTVSVTGSGPIIRAIQITIRIWDYKTNQTRQVTMVQAM